MLKRILTTSFFSIISRFFSMGTNLFLIFFISRYLSLKELGEYSIVFFFFQMFIVMSYFGMEVYLGREVSLKRKDNSSLNKIFSEFLDTLIYGSVLAFIFMLICALCYGEISLILIVLSYLNGVLFGLERNLGAYLLGKERVYIDAKYNVFSFIIVVGLAIFFRNELNIVLIFSFRFISIFIGVFGRYFYIKKDITNINLAFKIKNFKEISSFWFLTILVFMERQIDILILSFFIGKELLGSYYLALRIFFTVNLLIEVISHSLTPFISRSFCGKEQIDFRKILNLIFVLILFSGIFLGSILFMLRDFLISIFNKEFISECSPYLALLAIAVPFKVGRNLLGSILSSSKHQNTRFKINLIATIIFILSLPVFVSLFFTTGAIISRLIIEILIFSAYFYFVYFVIRVQFKNSNSLLKEI